MEENKKQYYNMMLEGNIDEAQKYKNNLIPDRLYKYFSFDNESCEDRSVNQCCKSYTLNNSKIETLENKKTWLASFDKLNDPFERRSLVLNYNWLEDAGYPMKVIKEMISAFYNSVIVTSLTPVFNSMPMWAHYSNNHNGFCVEYKIVKPDKVYPVFYEPQRVPATSIVANFINLTIKTGKEGIDPFTDKNYVRYFYCMFNNINMKHEYWTYEQEFRLVYIANNSGTPDDRIDNDTLGILVENIYVGLNCEPRCVDALERIAYANGYGLYKMHFPTNSLEYKLAFQKFQK